MLILLIMSEGGGVINDIFNLCLTEGFYTSRYTIGNTPPVSAKAVFTHPTPDTFLWVNDPNE